MVLADRRRTCRPNLPFGGVGLGWQVKRLLRSLQDEERRLRNQYAGPVLDIQTGIVLGEKRIACVAENAFHEIKVGYATAGSKNLTSETFP